MKTTPPQISDIGSIQSDDRTKLGKGDEHGQTIEDKIKFFKESK
ncbi:MAG: hypothetical protein WCS86_03035 [Candidatus Paceibacterota bacterium]